MYCSDASKMGTGSKTVVAPPAESGDEVRRDNISSARAEISASRNARSIKAAGKAAVVAAQVAQRPQWTSVVFIMDMKGVVGESRKIKPS